MKLITYRRGGAVSFGAVTDDGGIVDLGRRLDGRFRSVREVLAAGALAEARRAAQGTAADFAVDETEFLPVVPDAGKIICVGLNYLPHILEGGREVPKFPTLFPRYAASLVGHGQPMVRPKVSEKYDFEGEFAFVIGQPARHASEAQALAYVAGYTCFNDGSVRDWQRHTGQFLPGKNFQSSGAMGPWLVTSDELSDPASMTLATRLNGEEMQRADTGDLVFDVPKLIRYISTFIELEPGDVVVTGTPGGVGVYRDPPVFMKAGDVVEVEVSGIGTLRNPIVDER